MIETGGLQKKQKNFAISSTVVSVIAMAPFKSWCISFCKIFWTWKSNRFVVIILQLFCHSLVWKLLQDFTMFITLLLSDNLTLQMLEMEYSGFIRANTMSADALAPKVARASATIVFAV